MLIAALVILGLLIWWAIVSHLDHMQSISKSLTALQKDIHAMHHNIGDMMEHEIQKEIDELKEKNNYQQAQGQPF